MVSPAVRPLIGHSEQNSVRPKKNITDFFSSSALPTPSRSREGHTANSISVVQPSQHVTAHAPGAPDDNSEASLPTPRPRQPPPPSAVVTSFSSVSSLSSVPPSSQTSFNRRITKDGWQAVPNSDSSSDDSSADGDEDGLLDVAELVAIPPSKRRRLSPATEEIEPPLPAPTSIRRSERYSARLEHRRRRSGITSNTPSPPPPTRPTYKHSLADLVKRTRARQGAEAKLAAAEAAFASAQHEHESFMLRHRQLEIGLDAAVADDSDKGERMMLAVQRTEALQEDEKFYLWAYEGMPEVEGRVERWGEVKNVSPSKRLPFEWLRDEASWTMACVSGFVADTVAINPLSEEVCRWMVGCLLLDNTPEELCEAYVEILQVAYELRQFDGFGGLRSFHDLNEMCAAVTLSTNEGGPKDMTAPIGQLPRGLHYILRLLQTCTARKEANELAQLIIELLLANIDESIKGEDQLRCTVQKTVEKVVSAISGSDYDAVCSEIHKRFAQLAQLSLEIRCRIINSVPVFTKRLHRLRRAMALRLLMGLCPNLTQGNSIERLPSKKNDFSEHPPVIDFDLPMSSPKWNEPLLYVLKHAAEFSVSDGTAYTLLASLTAVADTAIDAGFGRPLLVSSSPAATSTLENQVLQTTRPRPISAEERAFNESVDALASQCKKLASRIRDAGSAHLHRTEAKSALERLVMRLEHGVRTRPPLRFAVFGRASFGQRELLQNFVGTGALPVKNGMLDSGG